LTLPSKVNHFLGKTICLVSTTPTKQYFNNATSGVSTPNKDENAQVFSNAKRHRNAETYWQIHIKSP